MSASSEEGERLLELARAHAQGMWTAGRAASALRAIELEMALEEPAAEGRRTSISRMAWLGLVLVFVVAGGVGLVVGEASEGGRAQAAAVPVERVCSSELETLRESLARLSRIRRLVDEGQVDEALKQLSALPHEADPWFERELSTLETRAECLRAAHPGQGPGPGSDECGRLARQRLLSRGL